jgi:hypothetical protein
MQITNYAQLVNAISNNAAFNALCVCNDDAHFTLQQFALRAIVDFMLADANCYAIACAEAGDTDMCVLHEMLYDDAMEV